MASFRETAVAHLACGGEDLAASELDRLVRLPVASAGARQRFADEIVRRFGRRLTGEAIFAHERRYPLLSARRVVTTRQALALGASAAVAALAAWLWPDLLLAGLVGLMWLLFASSVFFRAALALWGAAPQVSEPEPRAVADADLPLYTILVPLYREAGIVADLARAMTALDYPGIR